ncbi:hypothetical protein C9374_010868 [Naegleria lovaniensis]|uniref:Tyrosine specific protein phosphatases domain-containing protein n=1 Tax=Naegleria lovaniensis TaxID=51637 RepID=A0AA88KDN9_NAELO|nr:uncharacterized protein C9374_010868 [Naegleria lovaniensis]KAG2374298.1 hypothetical protein C9374_010868 [Naegleria lovaniensis]
MSASSPNDFLPPLVPMNHQEFTSIHRGPTDESNWLIPQRVLMSAYPGDLKQELAQQKIEKLIQSGINCFVCLQTEEELKRFQPYRPMIEKHVNENCNISSSDDAQSIEFLQFPIQDTLIASDSAVTKFIQQDLIPRIVSNHNCKILIHCWGGHGRTGTIAAILLSHLYELNADECLQRVAQCHKCRMRARGRAPTTDIQFKQVRRLCVGSKEQDEDDMA